MRCLLSHNQTFLLDRGTEHFGLNLQLGSLLTRLSGLSTP